MTKAQSKWLEIEQKYDSGVYHKHEVVMVRGQGATVWDDAGRSYIDCVAGYGVATLGHSHPDVVRAVQEQAGKLMVMPQSVPNDKRAEFLSELAGVLPQGLERIFLCNSGTEAVEAAKKFAITATGRKRFVSMKRGFSGRTLGALAFTWEPKYREPFGEAVDNGHVDFISYGDTEALRAAVTDETAAVIMEPVQGEGGIRPASQEFLQGLRDICDEKDLMLVFDEVQCGVARTGTLYAHEQYSIAPDIMASAKGIGGGFPVGACLATEKAASGMVIGTHGSTYGGTPLGSRAALVTVQELQKGAIDNAARMGERIKQGFLASLGDLGVQVEGAGLMLGVVLPVASCTELVARARDAGILLIVSAENRIRLLPPLIINEAEVDLMVQSISDLVRTFLAEKGIQAGAKA